VRSRLHSAGHAHPCAAPGLTLEPGRVEACWPEQRPPCLDESLLSRAAPRHRSGRPRTPTLEGSSRVGRRHALTLGASTRA
jgi:hypothetical protein